MNQTFKKLLSPKILFNHIVLAVFCCIVFFELNLLTNYSHLWYLYLVYFWLIVLSIHLIMVLVYLKKK
jgi:hypothetical protein